MNTHHVGFVAATNSQRRWRPVLVSTALAQILLIIVLVVVNWEVVPPLIAMVSLLAIGLVVLGNRPRAGGAVLGLVSLLHLVTFVPSSRRAWSIPSHSGISGSDEPPRHSCDKPP